MGNVHELNMNGLTYGFMPTTFMATFCNDFESKHLSRQLNRADACREQVATSHFWKSPKYSWTYIEHMLKCLWRQLLWQLSSLTLRMNIYQGELNWADACCVQCLIYENCQHWCSKTHISKTNHWLLNENVYELFKAS